MKLLNTRNHHLSYFSENEVPKYVILSHRWEEDEVTFQDMLDAAMMAGDELTTAFPLIHEVRTYGREKLMSKQGWNKITRFCSEADRRGYTYAWVDTCCIDKSSSAELQEAINSMYRWYRDAQICIVYLSDVYMKPDLFGDPGLVPLWVPQFLSSKWFSRGWTLQELLAPRWGCITFMDREWQTIGTDIQLVGYVSRASRISQVFSAHNILPRSKHSKAYHVRACSIAQKMSWAAKRKTTRPEDQAYSLLGLFEINMPLLYGEGRSRAFIRLQEEIMKTNTDETIFAWQQPNRINLHGISMVALSPEYFRSCGNMVASRRLSRQPFSWTSRGLQMDALMTEVKDMEKWQLRLSLRRDIKAYFAALNCEDSDAPGRLVCIILFDLDGSRWARERNLVQLNRATNELESWTRQPIHVKLPHRVENYWDERHSQTTSPGVVTPTIRFNYQSGSSKLHERTIDASLRRDRAWTVGFVDCSATRSTKK